MSLIHENCDKNGIFSVTLSRVEKHNALSQKMIDELSELALRIASDGGVRVVILKGEGDSFCAGADLAWMRQQITLNDEERREAALGLATMLKRWYRLPKPVIGRLLGNVFGGGVGLAAICDLSIASDDTVFALSETRLGLIPATISPYIMAKMGANNARVLMMSGRRFFAEEATKIGLIAKCVERQSLDEAVEAETLHYLESAPSAVAAAKSLSQSLGQLIDEDCIRWTSDQLVRQWSQPEAEEGVTTFFERRKPSWSRRAVAHQTKQ